MNVACMVCGNTDALMRCSQCRKAFYCCKEHQRSDWKRHKVDCKKNSSSAKNIIIQGSSEDEILNACTQNLGSILEPQDIKSESAKSKVGEMIVLNDQAGVPQTEILTELVSTNNDSLVNIVINDMNQYGVCVIDNFLGKECGHLVLNEVLSMYDSGIFKDGQLVSSSHAESKKIRGDKITWIDGKERNCSNIGRLINKVDQIIYKANNARNNGKMGDYTIKGRTKAMVACYPGGGSRYVQHVDNPNKDGRCITAIYYLNKDWSKECGGLLRIFPAERYNEVANIEPLFDRLLFFWSDRRNPHEVQESFKTRYAITLWFFDAMERNEAIRRHQEKTLGAQKK